MADRLDDPRRLEILRRTGLLDTGDEPALDRVTALTARLLRASGAAVSLVDDRRQHAKSVFGLPAGHRDLPLSHAFCTHVVTTGEVLVAPDTREHPLLRGTPSSGEHRAYVGVPLVAAGHGIGTLCVVEPHPRAWTRRRSSSCARWRRA